MAGSARIRQKEERRGRLLAEAARLIADRGYPRVRLEDLGAAAGVSGPAVYRHFPSKEAVLVELLVGVSRRILDGGRRVAGDRTGPRAALAALVDFHLDFALDEPELIRIQDREWHSLPADARHEVRRIQREYVELWVGLLCGSDGPDWPADSPGRVEDGEAGARVRAHAVFGLMNSTPYSAELGRRALQRRVLRGLARSCLGLDPT